MSKTPPVATADVPASALAEALVEALPRLYGLAPDPHLDDVLRALTDALERGILELSWGGAPPPTLRCDGWPRRHLQAVESSGLAREEGPGGQPGPLRLSRATVGWRRWLDQRDGVLDDLLQRGQAPLTAPIAAAPLAAAVATATRRGGLDRAQSEAVAALLRHRLVLLGGGPGTGKTSTVVQMLAARLELCPALRLHLAAPTGKAASRLRQAIAERGATLPGHLAGPLAQVPCTTLHRLLESRGDGFARDRDHPLALDLLVVDEVSMLDLPLTAALLDALPGDAQLLLVGDPGQLPPVGPGSVLSALQVPDRLDRLGAAAIQLSTTYRNDGAIARAAACLRADDPAGLREVLAGLEEPDNLRWHRCRGSQIPAAVLGRLREQQRCLSELALRWTPLDPASGLALLRQLDSLAVLAPTRLGPWGVETLHRQLLGDGLARGPAGWPAGTPVLCQRNRSEHGLANGDVGVVVEGPAGRRLLFAGAPDADGGPLRWLHPSRLAGVEPAWALTIHKAQGSQYEEVLVLMPQRRRGGAGESRERDPLDTRLLYTALTRARRNAVLITPDRWDGLSNPDPPIRTAPLNG